MVGVKVGVESDMLSLRLISGYQINIFSMEGGVTPGHCFFWLAPAPPYQPGSVKRARIINF